MKVAELNHVEIDMPLKPPHIKVFWLKRWPVLLPVIVGAAVVLFTHFDSKPAAKPEQKENHKIGGTNHVKTPIKN